MGGRGQRQRGGGVGVRGLGRCGCARLGPGQRHGVVLEDERVVRCLRGIERRLRLGCHVRHEAKRNPDAGAQVAATAAAAHTLPAIISAASSIRMENPVAFIATQVEARAASQSRSLTCSAT